MPRLFQGRSPPQLLTEAAPGCLEPPPTRRLRGADPHLLVQHDAFRVFLTQHPCLPSFLDKDFVCSKVPSLRGHYPASALLRTWPPPSRLSSLSRFRRLYDLPCSTDFPVGRGRFHQLLSMSLSPCCPYHPAEVTCRVGQFAPCHAAFARPLRARPSDYFLSRPPPGSLALRPGDSLTIPKMALSVGFIRFVSSANATQATGS